MFNFNHFYQKFADLILTLNYLLKLILYLINMILFEYLS